MICKLSRQQCIAVVTALAMIAAAGCARRTWATRLAEAEAKLSAPASTLDDRFYALPDAAKAAYELGLVEKAQVYANELAELTSQHRTNWNYGNAVHDANMVLGRIALRRGDAQAAAVHLQRAGETPGSPQLNSFSPNMSLANDLLRQGHTAPVLAYFEQCRRFWRMERGRLAEWSALSKAGLHPDFGANLVY